MLAFFFWDETMTDYLKVNLANWNDRAAIHIKDEAGGYRVKEFLNGADQRRDRVRPAPRLSQ